MAKKKKAKWLEESSVSELLGMLKEVLASEEVDTGKAQKIVAELIERTPAETDGVLSVEDAISGLENAFVTGLALVQDAYKAELDAVGDIDENDDEEADEEPAPKKDKKSKKEKKEEKKADKKADKKSKKDADEEDDEDGEDDDEGTDYTEMSQKALKKECRARGLKINKSMGKSDFIKALEADDKA